MKKEKTSFKIIKKHLKPLRPLFASLLVTSAISILCRNIITIWIQRFIDEASKLAIIALDWEALALILLVLFTIAISTFDNYLYNRYTIGSAFKVKGQMFNTIIDNPSLAKKYTSGDLINRSITDANELGTNISKRPVIFFRGIFEIILILGILFYYSWQLSIIILAVFPLYFHINARVNIKVATKTRQYFEGSGVVSQTFLQGIRGITIIRHLKRERYFKTRYQKRLTFGYRTNMQIARYSIINFFLQFFIHSTLPAIVAVIGIVFIGNDIGNMSIGAVLAVYVLTGRLLIPANDLNQVMRSYQIDGQTYERIKPIVECRKEADGRRKLDSIDTIILKIDNFGYEEGNNIINNLNLDYKIGQRLAITGASGGGKTTLLKLLMREEVLREGEGQILINDYPLESYSAASVYRHILMSSQNLFVFAGTLLDNITMGERFDEKEIEEVIEVCCLESFVAEYGIDKELQEDSKNISGGQLQRICLARILLRKPALLLLDEPTSALDKETTSLLTERLKKYLDKYKMSLWLVTHKDDVMDLVDNVLALTEE